jgi:hypothetical protein
MNLRREKRVQDTEDETLVQGYKLKSGASVSLVPNIQKRPLYGD